MKLAYILPLCLLSACTSAPPGATVPLRWVELPQVELASKCQALYPLSKSISDNACFAWHGLDCVIYTLPGTSERVLQARFQQTVGHEVLHCFKGFYHK